MSTRFRPIIRVFVSSTFGDLQKERKILQADVFPTLERHCAEREFQFQAIDLRWGVPGEAGLDHRTMRICFEELRRSQEVSPKPNFLVLLGDRYGWQPLTEEVSEKEHVDLERAAAELDGANPPKRVSNAREVLAHWYRRDENAVPPVHLLRSRHESPDGRDYKNPQKNNPNWEAVQQVLWAVINQAFPATDRANRFARIPKLNEPLLSIVKFQASATEQEIWRGALAVENASEHVVAWFREIREPEQYRSDKRAEDFFDREFFQGDDALRHASKELGRALKRKLGKVIPLASVSLLESPDTQRLEVTDDHLPEMCRYIQDELIRIIDQEISEYWKPRKTIASNTLREPFAALEPDLSASPLELRKLELEQETHERFGAERGANFVGREQELAAIAKYLDDEDRKPLVVYGPSGTGKTALLSRAAKLAEGGNRKVITRYFGITTRCSTLRNLLVNLCRELREPGTAPQSLPTDMTALQAEFDRLLVAAGRRQPVLLFLDALDQLDPADNARGSYWLRSPLPPGVKAIVSSLYDQNLDNSSDADDNEATNVPSREPAAVNQAYLSLQSRQLVERAIAVESLTERQAKELLERWLTRGDERRPEKRKLTEAQWKAVEVRICSASSTACRRPLYLRVLLEECRQWPSWKAVVSKELGENTSAQLRKLLHRLSKPSVHGRELVSAALGYLAAARRGLSENELLEVLWADPTYKAHLERASAEFHHELPRDAKRIPIAMWSRLRFDLDPYLAEQAAPGTTVVHFYHHQVARAVTAECLPDLDRKDDVRLLLADYFEPQPVDTRNCDELLWILFVTESFQDLRRCLLDIDRFLLAEEAAAGQIRKYWVKLKNLEGIGEAYLASFQAWEARPGKSNERISKAATEVGLFLFEFAFYRHAEPLLRKALEVSERLHGLLHPTVATALNNLAGLLQATNRMQEAEPLMRRALAIDEQSYGPDHPTVATDLNNLAGLLQVTNRLGEAEPLVRRALAIDEQGYGPDHPDVARDLNNLASLLKVTNRLGEAEPLMRRALAIDEQSYGPDHPMVATYLNNLALLLQATNRLGEAEPLVRRALAIDDQSYGPDHPDVAKSLNNLAQLLQATNRLREAEPLYRRGLAIDEQSYGPDHPQVATALNNLASLLYATNRQGEAEPLLRRVLAINEQSYGPDHPDVAKSLNNLASLLYATNRQEEAEPLLRRALAIDEQSYGPDHPMVATYLNNLAQLLQATNRVGEAEPLLRRSLAIDEQSYGPDHPEVAKDLNNLAQLLQDTNQLGEAEPLLRRALAILEKSLGPDHPDVASALNNLGQLLKATNRMGEAVPLTLRALAIDEQSHGPDHPKVATALNNLALLLEATNRLGEAEPLLRRALAILEKSLGPDHPDVASALNNLAQLLQATNRLEEAEPLLRRHLEIFLKFARATGHPHPHLRAAINNYAGLQQAKGRSREQVLAALRELAQGSFARERQELEPEELERQLGPEHPDVLRAWNNRSADMRKQGLAEQAEPIHRRIAVTTVKVLGANHPLTHHRRNNQVLTLILLDKLAEARELLRQNWQPAGQRFANTIPRVAFLAYVITRLEASPGSLFLGQLKTLFTGSELPISSDIPVPWDIADFIGQLRSRLPEDSADFLRSLLAAVNDRSKLPDLDRFPEWRNQWAIPLDTAWPEV